jgi:hypothetical protein
VLGRTAVFNHEVVTSYTVTVRVFNVNDTSLFDEMSVEVPVGNVDDTAPLFGVETVARSVVENTVGTLSIPLACDADNSSTVVVYTLTDDVANMMTINSSTGVLTYRAFDREDRQVVNANDAYAVRVWASDGIQNSSVLVVVTIQDQNDNSPLFGAPVYSFDLTEESVFGTTVGVGLRADASDADKAGTNASLFALTISGDFSSLFGITASTGQISTTGRVDREGVSGEWIQLVVTATDFGAPTRLSSNSTIVIHVTDINDQSPVLSSASIHVAENHDVGVATPLFVDTAVHIDNYPNNQTVYALVDAPTMFAIEAFNGAIYLSQALDYDAGDTFYALVVRATDALNTSQTSTSTVNVTVDDINDQDPQFTQATYSFSVTENDASLPSAVGVVSANLRDTVGVATYTLAQASSTFEVDSTTGQVSVVVALDREVASSHAFVVVVTDVATYDGVVYTRTANTTVVLTVVDENDNSPAFSNATYTFAVQEQTIADEALVGQVAATDPDAASFGTAGIVYTSDMPQFVFSGAELRTASGFVLDRDNNRSVFLHRPSECAAPVSADTVVLVVTATDANGVGRNTSVCVYVQVSDINDNAPVFTNNMTASVPEVGASNGRVVRVLTANDVDLGVNAVVAFRCVPPTPTPTPTFFFCSHQRR